MFKALVLLIPLLFALKAEAQPAPAPYGTLPTERQLRWQETEMYCIIHFGPDTFTDKEWGYGDENPAIFNPSHFDAKQIVGAAKAGGFKGIIVVAKHHDGFCLWPTKTTGHNISKSPYKNGKGDILAEYKKACDALGIKMGVYCSPWDRNSPLYGKPEYVTQIYRKQLEELYTNYGQLFMVWHDGANGGDGYYGGAREVRKIDRSTYYGWPQTWDIARRLQPGAVIFGDVGPDVRWVGNEDGVAGQTYWATYTPHSPEPGKEPGNGFVLDKEGTEGTRNGKYWMPAECDVPLRPGWFYHRYKGEKGTKPWIMPDSNDLAKPPKQLLDLYFNSVGRGACLDLGLAPDKTGQINIADVMALEHFGKVLKQTFAVNLAQKASITASNVRGKNLTMFGTKFLLDNDRYSYWATDDNVATPDLTVDMHQPKSFDIIHLRENIKLGQRVEGYAIDVMADGKWKEIANGTSIGANRLVRLEKPISASKLRIRITKSPVCVTLSDFGVYKLAEINDIYYQLHNIIPGE